MQKTIITICTILSALIILDSVNFASSVIYFIIAGRIPGTNVYIDATTVLVAFIVICGFFAGRLTTILATWFAQIQPRKQRA